MHKIFQLFFRFSSNSKDNPFLILIQWKQFLQSESNYIPYLYLLEITSFINVVGTYLVLATLVAVPAGRTNRSHQLEPWSTTKMQESSFTTKRQESSYSTPNKLPNCDQTLLPTRKVQKGLCPKGGPWLMTTPRLIAILAASLLLAVVASILVFLLTARHNSSCRDYYQTEGKTCWRHGIMT